jgi:hypothetical protein
MTPAYQEILAQIGAQIRERKGLLIRRTLLLTWPILLAIAIGYLTQFFFGEESAKQIFFSYPNYIYVVTYALFACLYGMIVNFTFEIEKRIWIDSFFDKKVLTPQESWKVSQKLFWRAIQFRFRVFVRYYVLPNLVFLSTIIAGVVLFYNKDFYPADSKVLIYGGVTLGVSFALFIFYSYYLNIRLRYTWFLFLDGYKKMESDYTNLFVQVDRLNAVMKSESFKKALVLNLGTDSIASITNNVISTMTQGLSTVAGGLTGSKVLGEMASSLTDAYGKELVQQIASYARIVAMYMLYQSARKEAFGEGQIVNTEVYNLISEGEK